MRLPLLLSLLLLGSNATAGPQKFLGFRPACDGLDTVQAEVDSCTSNKRAVESAKDCYQQLMRAWQEAPKDLKPVLSMSHMGQNAKQEETYARAQSDYQESMRKLRDLTALTDRNTDLIASYGKVLRKDPNQDVDCYTNARDQLQKIVDRLEDRIDEGLRADAASGGLKGISQVRDRKVDSSSRDGLIGKESRGAPRVALPSVSGRSRNRDSDVSGKIDNQELKPLRGQGSSSGPGIHKTMKNESDSAWVDSFLDNHK